MHIPEETWVGAGTYFCIEMCNIMQINKARKSLKDSQALLVLGFSQVCAHAKTDLNNKGQTLLIHASM